MAEIFPQKSFYGVIPSGDSVVVDAFGNSG